MKPTLVKETAIDIYQVSEELAKIAERDGEMSFRAQKTQEYFNEVKQMDSKKATEIREAIVALEVPRLKEDHIAKIIDTKPVSVEDLKQLVSSFNITVKDDFVKKIFECF